MPILLLLVMAWSSWKGFGCRIDDRTVREIADAVVASGMKDAGYTKLRVVDCVNGLKDRAGLEGYVREKGLTVEFRENPDREDDRALEVGTGDFAVQMSSRALLSEALIVSGDVRSMASETAATLMNAEAIAIALDPLGKPGSLAWTDGRVEVWTKRLKDGSMAVGIFNTGAERRKLSVGWRDIGLTRGPGMIRNVWRRTHPKPSEFGYPVELAGRGAVLLRVRH